MYLCSGPTGDNDTTGKTLVMGAYRPDVAARLIPGRDKSSARCVGTGRGVKTTRYGGLDVHVPSTRGCPYPPSTRRSGWRGYVVSEKVGGVGSIGLR